MPIGYFRHRKITAYLCLGLVGICTAAFAAGFEAGGKTFRLRKIAQGNALCRDSRPQLSGFDSLKIDMWKQFDASASLVMIGDSHTDIADWNEIFPNLRVVNRGVSGDTTGAVLARLDSILSIGATTAVLMLGSNDAFCGLNILEVSANYERIVSELLDTRTTVLVTSTPLTRDPKRNAWIDDLNARMKSYCETRRCRYLDLNPAITTDGVLRRDVTIDGVHLNGEGYARWAALLQPHLARSPPSDPSR